MTDQTKLMPCPACGKEVKNVSGAIFYANCDCYAEDIITPDDWNNAYCWKELTRLQSLLAKRTEALEKIASMGGCVCAEDFAKAALTGTDGKGEEEKS